MKSKSRHASASIGSRFALGAVALLTATAANAAPEIRLSATNRMPACASPENLMAFLDERNPQLDPRFRDIARQFKAHGETLQIRWDYAFFQMLLETNSLKFGGDVKSRQNNFAGIGASGGGARGDTYPDVSTGVLAQMQHLVAYSGEHVANPVAKRTRENQDHIIAKSLKLGRPVNFADLTRRWAMDAKYIRSIETLAERFQQAHCTGKTDVTAETAPVAQSKASPRLRPTIGADKVAEVPAVSGAELARRALTDSKAETSKRRNGLGGLAVVPIDPNTCQIWTASYGGKAAALIRADRDGETRLTVLKVESGSETRLSDAFIADHAPGAISMGNFANADDALALATSVCPAK